MYLVLFPTYFSDKFFVSFLLLLAVKGTTFLENMKMSSSLSKILETGINVFKINYKIIKNINNYEISTIYECVEK